MTRLRLATFNLESLDDRPGKGADFSLRERILRPQLQRLDADVLCLQEVNAQKGSEGGPRQFRALDRLLEGTAYADFHRATSGHGPFGREDEAPRDVHNLVVLSRFPILDREQLHNDLVSAVTPPEVAGVTGTDTPPPLAWDRPLLYVTMAPPEGQPLHVINLHLRAPTGSYLAGQKSGPFRWNSVAGWATASYFSGIKRSGQALEARLLVERIFDAEPDARIAVCGDLNAAENEVPLKLLVASDDDTGNGALASRAMIPVERSLPPEQRFSVLHHGRPQLLDHILVSRALLASYRGLEIHNESLDDELVAYRSIVDSPASLHAPLVASFDSARDQEETRTT